MVSMGRVLKAKSKPAATKAKTVTMPNAMECFKAPDGSTVCSETFINAPISGSCATVTVDGRPYKVCLLKNGKSGQVRCTHEAMKSSTSDGAKPWF